MNRFQRAFDAFNDFIAGITRFVFLICVTAFFSAILYFIIWAFMNVDHHNTMDFLSSSKLELMKEVLDD